MKWNGLINFFVDKDLLIILVTSEEYWIDSCNLEFYLFELSGA